MYIAVAGNIGSGKTTLTKMLSKHYGWKQYLEPVAENPYIDDYYKDIHSLKDGTVLNDSLLTMLNLKQILESLLQIEDLHIESPSGDVLVIVIDVGSVCLCSQ